MTRPRTAGVEGRRRRVTHIGVADLLIALLLAGCGVASTPTTSPTSAPMASPTSAATVSPTPALDPSHTRLANDAGDRLRLLEEARALDRGEYLDDCPFYGDSVYVEEQRAALRGRSIDLLTALGEGYETSGDRVSAAAAYRQAIAVAVDGCPPAEAGLSRLAAPS
jgi:hypothetical protein